MPIEFSKECDVGQGYNFKQDEHHTFGYLNTLVFGENNIAPDIRVAEPPRSTAGTAQQYPGVDVPTRLARSRSRWWRCSKAFSGRRCPTRTSFWPAAFSIANSQQLNMLLMQSPKEDRGGRVVRDLNEYTIWRVRRISPASNRSRGPRHRP